MAVGGEGDDAAVSGEGGELVLDDFVRGGLEGHAFVLDEGADGAGDGEADEEFAGAGGGDGAGVVVGKGAGADDGGVADAIEAFGLGSSGGGAGGDVSGAVADDDPDGAVFVGFWGFDAGDRGRGCGWGSGGPGRDGSAFFFELLDERLPAAFGEEEGGRDLFEVDGSGELVGAGGDEHDVRALEHDGAGELDGVAGGGDAGDGSGLEGGAVHDGGVELVFAVGGEDGSAAGVEERVVFEDGEGDADGVDGGAVPVENRGGGVDGGGEAGAVGDLGFGFHGGAFDDAGAAVEDDGPLVRGGLGGEFGGLGEGGEGAEEHEDGEEPEVLSGVGGGHRIVILARDWGAEMRHLLRVLLAAVAVLSLAGSCVWGQDIAGDWQGRLKAGPGDGLRVVVHFSKGSKGGWAGMLYSIDQGPDGMALTSVEVAGAEVKFAVAPIGGSYAGKLNAGGTVMVGTWTQGGPLPLELDRATGATAWQRDSSPHTVRMVPVDKDVKLEVLDWGGTGRPVVLLAGLGNSAHVFDEFALKLTAKYHVYGVTRRGFGASSAPEFTAANYSADRLGDDVLAVMAALKIDRPVVVGHSIAGEELSSIGSRHPEKVAGLVYLDAGYGYAMYDREHGDFFIDLIDLRRKLGELMPGGNAADPRALAEDLRQTAIPRFLKELDVWEQMLAVMPPPRPRPDGPEPASAATAIVAGEEKYTAIGGPVLAIFAGETADWTRTGRQIQAFTAGVPTARVVRLEHADHYVFRSNEADVLRQMDVFIAGLK